MTRTIKQETASYDAVSSGGGGNRTRVPKHFSAGFYVCSPSTFDGQCLAALPSRSPRAPPTGRLHSRLIGCEV